MYHSVKCLTERKVSAWPTEASLRDGPHNIEGVPDLVGTSIRKQYNFQLVTTESRLFCEPKFSDPDAKKQTFFFFLLFFCLHSSVLLVPSLVNTPCCLAGKLIASAPSSVH